MKNVISEIIALHVSENEELLPFVEQLLERVIPKIIEAGVLNSDTGKYRYGSGEENENEVMKRIINNLLNVLKSPEGIRVGVVDTSEENLRKQYEILRSQIMGLLRGKMNDSIVSNTAEDIADVILTSWLLVWSQPNESGWARKWI